MKLKRILLTLFLAIGLNPISVAGYLDDWTDDQLCGWMDNPSPPAHIVAEVKKRGISCEGGKAVAGGAKTTTKSASSTKSKASTVDSDITIYEVVFSPAVLKELLDRVISKTDYDFSKHKLANNVKDLRCTFKIRKVAYEESELGEIEDWNMAEGKININGSDVEFAEGSFWRRGGLSTDPSYLQDEVNIKLTEDGYLVGKMAYFSRGVAKGEVPVNPLYVTLTKHKRSKPINLKSIENPAELWIDVEDWAGGVMFVSDCKQPARSIIKTSSIEASDAFDGSYSFIISLLHSMSGNSKRIGNGYIEINNGIMTVAKDGRSIVNGSEDLYDSFEGRIDKKGNIISWLTIIPQCSTTDMTLVGLDLKGHIKRQIKNKCFVDNDGGGADFDVVLKLRKKE